MVHPFSSRIALECHIERVPGYSVAGPNDKYSRLGASNRYLNLSGKSNIEPQSSEIKKKSPPASNVWQYTLQHGLEQSS
jgi:hypothetical protein